MIELNNLGEFSVVRRPLEGFVGRTSLSMGWGYILFILYVGDRVF